MGWGSAGGGGLLREVTEIWERCAFALLQWSPIYFTFTSVGGEGKETEAHQDM